MLKNQNLLNNLKNLREANGLLSSLGIRTFLNKIPLLGDILF